MTRINSKRKKKSIFNIHKKCGNVKLMILNEAFFVTSIH